MVNTRKSNSFKNDNNIGEKENKIKKQNQPTKRKSNSFKNDNNIGEKENKIKKQNQPKKRKSNSFKNDNNIGEKENKIKKQNQPTKRKSNSFKNDNNIGEKENKIKKQNQPTKRKSNSFKNDNNIGEKENKIKKQNQPTKSKSNSFKNDNNIGEKENKVKKQNQPTKRKSNSFKNDNNIGEKENKIKKQNQPKKSKSNSFKNDNNIGEKENKVKKPNQPTKKPSKKINSKAKLSFLGSLSSFTGSMKCDPTVKKYKLQFQKNRDGLISVLYKLYNEELFDNKLPASMHIKWNPRLRKTAGRTYNMTVAKTSENTSNTRNTRNTKFESVKISYIELSSKIVDSAERLRDTLLHELCHAANFFITGIGKGHGPSWQMWADKAMKKLPELPAIRRTHCYKIKFKFIYKCTKCGQSFGRHSKFSLEEKRCGFCYGIFQLMPNK